jgi:hypothetical protein
MRREEQTGQAARKQSLFREVNERINEISGNMNELSPDTNCDSLEVICECADVGCTEPFVLTRKEYEAIRDHPNRFPIKSGHELPEVEEVVHREASYVVVEKLHPGSLVAEALDARD